MLVTEVCCRPGTTFEHSMVDDGWVIRTIKDGELDGFIEWYCENGQLASRANYKDGEKKGVVDGDLIQIFNKTGSFICQAHLTSGGGLNMLYMYHVWDPMMFKSRHNCRSVV